MRAAEHCRGIKITQFVNRQLRAIPASLITSSRRVIPANTRNLHRIPNEFISNDGTRPAGLGVLKRLDWPLRKKADTPRDIGFLALC